MSREATEGVSKRIKGVRQNLTQAWKIVDVPKDLIKLIES